jgi:hypothetical protein
LKNRNSDLIIVDSSSSTKICEEFRVVIIYGLDIFAEHTILFTSIIEKKNIQSMEVIMDHYSEAGFP